MEDENLQPGDILIAKKKIWRVHHAVDPIPEGSIAVVVDYDGRQFLRDHDVVVSILIPGGTIAWERSWSNWFDFWHLAK